MNENTYNDIKTKIKTSWIDDIKDKNDDDLIHQSKTYIKLLETLSELQVNTSTTSQDDTQSQMYYLRRKLKGGSAIHVNDKHQELFIPEKIIRRNNLEHGDYFLAREDAFNKGYIYCEKINRPKNNQIEPNRIISHDHVVVTYNENTNQFISQKSYNDFYDEPKPISIHEQDAKHFKLEDGDVVEIAHFPNNDLARVRWKYEIEDLPTHTTPKKSSFYKEKTTQDDNLEPIFENLIIGIFGTDTFINNYKEEVEKRGGSVLHTESDNQQIITNAVKQSDLIVIPTQQVSHNKALMAKEEAKIQDKPFIILENNGRSFFVNKLRSYLE